jgi:hypothetical protein
MPVYMYIIIYRLYVLSTLAKWGVHIYDQYAKYGRCTILHIGFWACILFDICLFCILFCIMIYMHQYAKACIYMQNDVQNNSATSIFCILCILQYAKYAKYDMMTYAYSVFCVIFCIFSCIISFIFCIFSCIFCIFPCIFCLARQAASATHFRPGAHTALAEHVPEPGPGRPARIRQRPWRPHSLPGPRRPASREAGILGGHLES